MKIFQFRDMHSGGGQKLDWDRIFIESPVEQLARWYFQEKFGRDPDYETCETCGSDYSISEYDNLVQATAFDRNCRYDDNMKMYVEEGGRYHWLDKDDPRQAPYLTLEEYLKQDNILFVPFVEVKSLPSISAYWGDIIHAYNLEMS